jgi:hypothetical protein
MQPLRQCGSKHHSGGARSHSYGQKMGRRRKLYFMAELGQRVAKQQLTGLPRSPNRSGAKLYWSSIAFASFKSCVSKPPVNQA